MAYVVSVQSFTVTIAAAGTSGTVTINSVDTNRAVIFFDGGLTTNTTAQSTAILVRLALTNATTITATRGAASASFSQVTRGYIVEFSSDLLDGDVQYGTVTIAAASTSNTATINSISTSRAAPFYLGNSATEAGGTGPNNNSASMVLTDAKTITCTRSGTLGTLVTSFVIPQFLSGVIQSVQHRAPSVSGTNLSDTDTISSVGGYDSRKSCGCAS